MREIGSEFWDVPAGGDGNHLFPESVRWFLSGRGALGAIIRELGDVRTAAMPSWCCDSMIRPFTDAGIEVRFYPVTWRGKLTQEIRDDCDVLLVMDYFGYTADAADLSLCRGKIIRDVTHSLFSGRYSDADYYFGSLRKWCGVWTGGYAWGKGLTGPVETDRDYVGLRRAAMEEKAAYIQGGETGEKNYLKLFGEAEKRLKEAGIRSADPRDIAAAKTLDAEFIRSRRRRNAKVLMEGLPDLLVFPELAPSDCPLFVPILAEGGRRDALRQRLIAHSVYCPAHWPATECHRLDENTAYLYENELSLVCDQRYTEEDMERMVKIIKSFL